jgi:3-carboxy-cis,cis-muconate cycloisomerase
MPQKRNPTEAMTAIACARLAIGLVPTILAAAVQEHERAVGGWQAEWQAVPELLGRTSGAVEWTRKAVQGLEVHAGRMRANLELTDGLILAEALAMALAHRVGKDDAYKMVRRNSDQAAAERIPLRRLAAADKEIRALLSPEQLDRVFDVSAYLGSNDALISRALDAFHQVEAGAHV